MEYRVVSGFSSFVVSGFSSFVVSGFSRTKTRSITA